MFCTKCGTQYAQGESFCTSCGASLSGGSPKTNNLSASKTLQVIEAVKTVNTPCLWVSLDYWNLYLKDGEVIAARMHRGWFGLIGFILGLFLYIITFVVTSAIGILLDKNSGETKCSLMRNRLDEVLDNPNLYAIVNSPIASIGKVEASDMCLGSLWLKYMIKINGKKFYLEEDKYIEMTRVLKESSW